MCCSHKNGILERKTQQTLLFKLKFVFDKHNFPLYREIIIPLIKVTHFTLNFSQYVNFHKTSHHISLCILTVSKATICCKIYMHMRYICGTYRSLTPQREHSTYSRRRAQCRNPKDLRITLTKIEKILTKNYLEKTDIFTYAKRDKYAVVHYQKDLHSLLVHLYGQILRGSKT